MNIDVLIPTTIFGGLATLAITAYIRHRRRLAFIDSYPWPKGLIARLKQKHPTLPDRDIARIEQALRQYFRAYVKGGLRYVSMPSQAADDLWHEFILYTKSYDAFCGKAFGRFLHHTPAVVLANGRKQTNEGLRRVWWQCCKEEGIDPHSPKALPLLFALDAALGIPGGYRYTPDCRKTGDGASFEMQFGFGRGSQCGGDFSSTSFDGGTDGLGDGSGGDGDGDGGGCGGD